MSKKVPKNGWYCKGKSSYQISLYKLFVERRGIPIEKIIESIERYRPNITKPNEKKVLLDDICHDFSNFLKVVTEVTGIKFKKRKRYTYEDWWQESNLDGSFAYDGVTDDF